MAEGARVNDPTTIRMFRAAVIKFIESSNAALIDAEGDIVRRMSWCEGEQSVFWQQQIRKLADIIGQLKEQIRMKKLFKDSSGRTPSAFDEEKKLRAAMQRLQTAEEKLANTRRWAKQLQKEHLIYRGGVQRLQTMLQSDLVNGVAMLDTVLVQLEQYLSAGAPQLAGSDASCATSVDAVTGGAMHRAADGPAGEGLVDGLPDETPPPILPDFTNTGGSAGGSPATPSADETKTLVVDGEPLNEATENS